jgi:GalNAc-alpha-(1->4)-GalNAc-alpha-(1->3)-diNAcBac-PP-undecaprenol alpha-1,4-N-acetyl-D-galactosaminyltransferase
MKIALLTASLSGGGIARAISTMANHWVEQGRSVTLVSFDHPDVRPQYPLSPEVTVVATDLIQNSRGVGEALLNNFSRVRAIRRTITGISPDVVISFGDQMNVVALLGLFGSGLAVLVAERVDPGRHHIGRLWSGLRSLTYRWAKCVVVQTSRSAGRFPQHIRQKAVVIPNPVPPMPQRASGRPDVQDFYTIVAMGRLDPQKGFDILIEAFASVAVNRPDWNLVIFGEGPERGRLEALCRRLSLGERVSMPGVTSEPAEALSKADLFVLSSRYEGFPNALCEAMAAGLAVIATDCDSGPAEIMHPDEDGLMVPVDDTVALAGAMARLMDDKALRKRFGANASRLPERFPVVAIMGKWDSIVGRYRRHAASERALRLIVGSFGRGGAETQLSRVLPRLKRRGWSVRVLTLTGRGELADGVEGAGVSVQFVGGRSTGRRLPSRLHRAFSMLMGVYKDFRRDRDTITWFMLPESYVVGMIAARLAGLRGATVMSRRSLNDYQARYPGLRWLERRFHRRAFLILGNSAAVVEQLRDSEGVPEDKLRLIYGGVDSERFSSTRAPEDIRTELNLGNKTFVMVIVANLIPYKGHRDLLDALGKARGALPADWCLLCIGSPRAVDDGAYAEALEALAGANGIGGNILWLGVRGDVADLLCASDLGLLTSHQEGFSNALLEMMAAGLPVVATDVGGNREAVAEGVTGLIVQPHSPDALAEAITRLAGDRDLRGRFAQAGRERVMRRFTLTLCVEHYDQLFSAVSQGRVPPALEDLTLKAVVDHSDVEKMHPCAE